MPEYSIDSTEIETLHVFIFCSQMLRVFRRGYAADPKIGSKAKGGTGKSPIQISRLINSLQPKPQ
jgi:hypothetical protein